MTNELTAQQAEVVSEALSRLEKLIHFADAEMKSATLEHINNQLLYSSPGGTGTFLSHAVNSLNGSIGAKILRDAIRPVLQLRGSVPGECQKSLKTLRAVVASLQDIKQTAKRTIEQTIHPTKTDDNATKLQPEKKPWTDLATDLKNKWFTAMRKKNQWIPRNRFLTDFLNGTERQRDKWQHVNAATEDKRFSDNPDQWKAESETLKVSFKQATRNRR